MLRKEFNNFTWDNFFNEERCKNYFVTFQDFIKKEYEKSNDTVFPQYEKIFLAFNLTTLSELKVVILGQDPYPQKGISTGLAFATNNNIMTSSLKNIIKKLYNEYSIKLSNTSLINWAKQGVLLINKILIAKENMPNYYDNLLLNTFTNNLFMFLNKVHKNIVYILLGNNALKIKKYLNEQDNLFIISSHPSGLSCYKKLKAYSSFNDTLIFKKCNQYLKNNYKIEVNWFDEKK